MSYSLAVADGDLVQQGSQLALVWGQDKLLQDVDLWLRERYGIDRFHVTMGSVLQDFIGGIVDESTRAEVQSEILRVLQNYQAVQLRKFKQNPQMLSATELLISVDDVQTTVSYDTVSAWIKMRNATGVVSTVAVSTSTTG